jgi:cyclic lactone autoinducer peptide
MKEKLKFWLLTGSKVVFSMALAVFIFDINSTCSFACYQPKIPEGFEKFKMVK